MEIFNKVQESWAYVCMKYISRQSAVDCGQLRAACATGHRWTLQDKPLDLNLGSEGFKGLPELGKHYSGGFECRPGKRKSDLAVAFSFESLAEAVSAIHPSSAVKNRPSHSLNCVCCYFGLSHPSNDTI
jgi:hypothetical protein